MATKRWIGQAQAVAQVDTVTIGGTPATNDTVTLTINNKSLVVTIGEASPTTTTVATAIKEAWENETFSDTLNSKTPANGGQDIIEFAEITATSDANVVTLTHDTAGVPFTLSSSSTGSTTETEATATAATGPNFWDNTDNWDTGSVPVDTDDIYIDNSDISILYNIEPNLGAGSESLNLLYVGQNFTGEVGLPQLNVAGYIEYRPQYLKVEADDVVIGRGSGTGSGRIKLDTDAQPCAMRVENTGSPAEVGLASVLWKGSNTTNTLTVLDGSVDVAAFGGETANLDDVEVTAGTVRIQEGVTMTGGAVVSNQAGSLEIYTSAATVENVGNGTTRIGGSAAVSTSLLIKGGTVLYDSSGTITAATVGGSGPATLEFSTNVSRTVSALTVDVGATVRDEAFTKTVAPTLASDVRVIVAS